MREKHCNVNILETDLLLINILPFNPGKELVLHDFLGIVRTAT